MTLGPGISRTTLPEGFSAAGVNCGVRRYRPDIGLILSDRPSVAVAVFTQSEFVAAPVTYSRGLVPTENLRAIFTNSGQANAATGTEGVANNLSMVKAVAEVVGCQPEQVLVASTGVIGPQLDLAKILPGIPQLMDRLTDTAENFSLAILTTDLVPKAVTLKLQLKKGEVRLTGIAKGSGMIHPNMATMLGYILTDASVPLKKADAWLKSAVNESFNMISVDGDTSTNDCVFFMANGASQVELADAEDEAKFQKALKDVAIALAQAIVSDGEGAGKLIEVRVTGAPTLQWARKAARGVTLSPLVKTAMHGEDPNWGRIVARLGAEQVPGSCLQKMRLTMQGHLLFDEGQPKDFVREKVRADLKRAKIVVEIDLKSGEHSAVAWGCDLSRKYVDINTEYPT